MIQLNPELYIAIWRYSNLFRFTLKKSSLPTKPLSATALAIIATPFRALWEPMRLRLLNLLMQGEQTVGQLADASSCARCILSAAAPGPLPWPRMHSENDAGASMNHEVIGKNFRLHASRLKGYGVFPYRNVSNL